MTNKEFKQLLEQRIIEIQNTLDKKAQEYVQDEDRLYNFKVAGKMSKTTPTQSCWHFLTKHLVCVRDLAFDKLSATESIINEKIGDAINYLILLEALLKEKDEED